MQRRGGDCRSPGNAVQNSFSKHSMTPKIRPSVKSGACTVCSAPCSSCMHRNQPLMDPKNREFSDETCRSVTTSKRCEGSHPTTSETSHPISVNSSHDSVSENADSKAAVRSSDVGLPPRPLSSSNPGGFVVQCEDSVSLDTHDNEASCVSRASGSFSLEGTRRRNVERKNILCSSTSDSNLTILSNTAFAKDGDTSSNSLKETLFESTEEKNGGSSKETAVVDKTSCPKSILCISDPPEKILPKVEPGIDSNHKEQLRQGEKSNEMDVKEPPLQSVVGDDGDDSDIVEHDVKVCDICGDAGREELLATCSRCSDGAEHTYCMRKMLRKLPGSNWMCEECKFAEENSQKRGTEGKKLSKLRAQLSSKRLAENTELVAKRQALETSVGSPKSSNSSKMASLSRESSFKSLDKERSRPTQYVNASNQSTNNTPETSRSSVPAQRHQNLKGLLLKSNSFNVSNFKPKVKLVDDVIPQKRKGVKDHSSSEAKEMPTRAMGKSMSFKSSNLSRSSSSVSKLKMMSPRIPNKTVDPKGLKHLKERNTFERRSMSKLDHPPVSLSNSSVSTPKGEVASRVESSLLSFASNSRDSKAQNDGKSTTTKATANLARKPTEPPTTSVGVPKDEPIGTMPDGLFQLSETAYQTESLKESSLRPRPPVISSSRSTFCQKCKEIGHSAEFCRSGCLDASASDASTVTSRIRDETQSGSKLKDAIQAALLRKPEIQRRKRAVDQLDESSTPNTSLDSEVANHEKSFVFNKPKHNLSTEGTNNGHHVLSMPVGKSSFVKPMEKDFTNHGLASAHQLAKVSAIPEYEYTWRGCFEVIKNGSLLELCGGIQAHLSTCVSPRVPEVVQKFPKKLSLSEVPRSSAWPTQFWDAGAKDDNIALYFFAKDIESYERSYKSLLHRMVKNDLALKGNFEGVELLIFPSNQLPETSQRWNMLFYLWGVFRARKGHCSDPSIQLNVANTTAMPDDKKTCYSVLRIPENLCSTKLIDLESSGGDRSGFELSGDCKDQKLSVPMGLKANTRPQDRRNGSKFTSNVDLSEKIKGTSSSSREKSPSDNTLRAEPKPSVLVAGGNSSRITEKPQIDCNASADIKDSSSPKGAEFTGTVCEKKVSGKMEFARERSIGRGEYRHQPTERKRQQIDLSEPPTQEVPWNGVSIGKRRRMGEDGGGEYSWRSEVKTVDSKVKNSDECEEKVIPEDLGSGSAERHFFPVDRTLGWKSLGPGGGEERLRDEFPNLELALGGETKPVPPQSKGILPFLVANDKEEDVSASLSLSLAFPIPDKEEAERRRPSSSLLFFGAYPKQ